MFQIKPIFIHFLNYFLNDYLPHWFSRRLLLLGIFLFGQTHGFAMTLDELVEKGLNSYPSVLTKQSYREAAQSDVLAAKLRFFPTPSVNTQRQSISISGQDSIDRPTTTITISQPIPIDGGIIAGYWKADARLSAADFGIEETREDVARRIVSAYSDWLRAYLKIQALEESVKLHVQFSELISRRYTAGVASEADKNLGVSRLSQVRADLSSQQSFEQTSLSSLSALVGEPITRADLIGKIAQATGIPNRSDGLMMAQDRSPTIQRSEFEAKAAEQEAKEIRGQALPQLAFQAQRQIGTSVFGVQSYDMYGLVLTYSPNSGIASIPSTSAAFTRAEAAKFQIETSKRELMDRLNADYNEYEVAVHKKVDLTNSVNLSGDISASYNRQYLVGRKSWLDLMNAVREQVQTKVQLADVEGILLGTSRRLSIAIHGTQWNEESQK